MQALFLMRFRLAFPYKRGNIAFHETLMRMFLPGARLFGPPRRKARTARKKPKPRQTMTNPKTDHKGRKPAATPHPGASTAVIEACDRLGQKLDQVASVVREQIEAWKQIREASASHPDAAETRIRPAAEAQLPERVPQGARVQDEAQGPSANPPAAEDGGLAAMAQDARRLADTLSQSRDGGQEEAAGVRQALEAIMDYLEGQAAKAAPKADETDIMSRLRDLQEQQQSLQNQVNNNRWGP
jgi:hypothetical protein